MEGAPPSARSQTLPTSARVRKRREFLALQSSGRRMPTRHFLVVAGRAPSGPVRIGITVTRKIGCAVERNRVKRNVREVFRRERSRLGAGLSLVVIARDGSPRLGAVATAAELAPAFLALAERTGDRAGREPRAAHPGSAS